MTCHEAREWLSALIDDAIDPPVRVEVEAHVLGCPECGLELRRLRATVGLLRRVEPVRAPAGFVDRVMDRARPAPWYRRAAAWLFLPLSVKLPAQAAAIVVMAGLAMLLIDRTPELRDAARVEPPAPPPVAQPPAPPPVAEAPPQPLPTPSAQVIREAPAEKIAPAPPASRPEETPVARRKAAPAPSATRGEAAREASGKQVASAPSAPSPAAPPQPAMPAPPPAVTAESSRPPTAAQARPPATAESFEAKRERGPAEGARPAPSVGRVTGTAVLPADLAGRLEVRDRNVAVASLADLLSKVGGGEVTRHQEGADIVIDVLVPERRYDDFVRGLEALGAWSGPGVRQRVMLDSAHVHLPIRIAQ